MSSVIVRIVCWLTLLTLKAHCNSFSSNLESIGNTLSGGDSLEQGQALLSSNGEYALVLESDGNLVVYSTMNNEALWESHTNDGVILYYELDGNLVLYNSQTIETNVWSSKTDGTHQPGRVEMRNDGYFVIFDDMFNEVWNCQEWEAYESVQTVPYPFPPPEPLCDIGDTYVRSLTPATCPDDKVTMAGLCYYKCSQWPGYTSYTGFDCIADCPSGYTDMGVVCTDFDKTCQNCDKICVPFVGCDKICSPEYACPDTIGRHIHTRIPSYPDSCPPGYQDPSILTGGTFCYKSCEPGFLDLGGVCTCDIDIVYTYHSDVVIYAEKFSNFYDIYITQLLDSLNLLDCLTGSSLGIDIMEPFIEAIKEFIAIVDGIVNGNYDAGNDKLIIVLEIGCSAASVISVGIGAFGYVFDPNTNKYYYYEGAHCYGLATDVSASVDVSLFLFHSIGDVAGISQALGGSYVVGDAMVITSETLTEILASGFSFSYGTPGAWPVGSWHMCETPQLKEI